MIETNTQNSQPKTGFTHDRDLINGKEEWLTPPDIVRALGEFDLDPCSPTPETRPWSTAKNHYSIIDDGIKSPWFGRVWCNPPYGAKTGDWMQLCAAHKNVTALIFARTETNQFFNHIWPKAKAVCFLKGRLSFYHVNGTKGGTAGAPSMLVAWDDFNANAIKTALEEQKLHGAFVPLNGASIHLS